MTIESSGAPRSTASGRTADDSDELRQELTQVVSPRYQVGELIGRGGMAFVYRGWDTAGHRSVAFKVLKREYAAIGHSRFSREIRLLTQLHHPGILPLLDSGQTKELSYLIMPLVEGETLQERLEREPQLPLDEVRRIVDQVATALDYAHGAGVVHRDIKPSNLFLVGDHVLLADFGIAKDRTPPEDETTTSTGLVLGTVLYISPEQADGNVHPDQRADVYSLGCVTYQMLAGEPPFTGSSTQALLARHRFMPAPSVRLVRPDLPAGVDAVIRKAMAKSAADRYPKASDFAAALSDPAKLAAAAREAEVRAHPLRRWAVPVGALLAGAAVAGVLVFSAGRTLSPNRVVVFPLGENPPEATSEGTGVHVALMIGSALEFTEPLEWIDGLPLLDLGVRENAGLLTAADARRTARAAGARWYVDGTVLRRQDSVTVVVRLNDAAGDSVVGRRSATRGATQAAQAGLDAVKNLLPRLLSPGQRIDLSALADRQPAAVASWLQGERKYRQFDFAGALEFQQRAVSMDSALAVAALRGAQAASWLDDIPEARALAQTALRHVALLPPRVADFARGLHAYLEGEADSAVHWLGLALRQSPDWTEAHMALGEVYYHLLPRVTGPHDSLAESEFLLAAADTGFTLPLFHLAEIAIRRRTSSEAERRVENFVRHVEDESSRVQLMSMLTCMRDGRKAVDWGRVAAVMPVDALRAAQMLAVGGAYPGCAEDGLRAVFDSDTLELGIRWGAFLGLQGLLAAEGRVTELRQLVDSAIAGGMALASQLYLLDALAGVKVEREASTVAEHLALEGVTKARPFTLWLLGAWYARGGDSALTAATRTELLRRADSIGDPWLARYADVLGARLALLEGDTAAALEGLSHALSTGRRERLDWDVGESLAADRLLLAELLLERGQAAEGMSVAAVFDHPAPAVFLPFLPASLTLRRRAALALGQRKAAGHLESRLAALGQGSQMSYGPSPLTSMEAP
jgi:hypothetical protein